MKTKQITLTLPAIDLPATGAAWFNLCLVGMGVGAAFLDWRIGLLVALPALITLRLCKGLTPPHDVHEPSFQAGYVRGRADVVQEARARREQSRQLGQGIPAGTPVADVVERVHADAASRACADVGDFEAPKLNGAITAMATACALSCLGSLPVWLAAMGGVL